MTQSRLNHCLLTHIYKEKFDPNQTMSTFIASNEKRQADFGLIVLFEINDEISILDNDSQILAIKNRSI
jgi:hypothetical protein